MSAPSRRARALLPLALLSASAVFGCGRSLPAPTAPSAHRESGPLRVVTSIPPLESLAQSLTPSGSQIGSIIAPGQSPHTFEPKPSDLDRLARADLVVIVGLGIEASLPHTVLATTRCLSMSEALGLAAANEHEDSAHDHEESAHEHTGADPHLWLDPALVADFVPILAERVRAAALSAGATPTETQTISDHEAALLQTVRSIDAAYRERLAPFAGAAIITQHGAWSRLADRYGLEVVGVIQGAESVEPSAAHIADLLKLARDRHVHAVLTEPQLDSAIARRIAGQLHVPVGTLDPLGSGDWAQTMRANLDALVDALRTAPEPPPG